MRTRNTLVVLGSVLALVAVLAFAWFRLAWGVGDEVPAGDNYEVVPRLMSAQLVLEEGVAGLRFNYEAAIRSRERPGFQQTQRLSRLLGIEEPRTGGIHDWSLFRTLDTWPRSRRVAYLAYVASRGNPDVILASTLKAGDWPGAWWSETGPDRTRALEIGRLAGFAEADLVWTEYFGQDATLGELLGIDAEGRCQLLASGSDVDFGTVDRLREASSSSP
jgi:hypothetical protein